MLEVFIRPGEFAHLHHANRRVPRGVCRIVTAKSSSPILLETLDLHAAERLLCERALQDGGSIVAAAQLLGITRHSLKRRIIKLRIVWPPRQPDLSGSELRAHSS